MATILLLPLRKSFATLLNSIILWLYGRWFLFQVLLLCISAVHIAVGPALVFEGTLCTSPAAPRQRSGAALVWYCLPISFGGLLKAR